MSNFEYSQATLDWIKADEEREEEVRIEYLRLEKFQRELQWHKEAINSANREYAQFLLEQGFEFITEQSCYYWTKYLAVHNTYIARVKEYGRDYYNREEDLEPIPDWAIIEITQEVYEAKG